MYNTHQNVTCHWWKIRLGLGEPDVRWHVGQRKGILKIILILTLTKQIMLRAAWAQLLDGVQPR